MKEILIDGYNFIKQSDRLSRIEHRGGLHAGREGLLRALAEYRRATGDRVTVYFDGDDGLPGSLTRTSQGGIQMVYSRPPDSADDLIAKSVARSHGKRSLLVVSSDRAVRRAAEQHRIEAVGCEAFEREMRRRCEAGPSRPSATKGEGGEPKDPVDWEALFRTERPMFGEE